MRLKLGLMTVLALLVAACGGGDDPAPFKYDRLVSFGDSLSDLGTHNVGTIKFLSDNTGGGGRWTVNSTAGGEMWTERLAAQLQVSKPCPAEIGLKPNLPTLPNQSPFVGAPVTAVPGCFSYAQGSSRITSPLGPNAFALQQFGQSNIGLLAKPMAEQFAAHLSATAGQYTGQELVTVMAGANDVFMELALLGGPLGAQTPEAAVGNVAVAGATLGQLIKAQVLGKGAKRVLVLNVPDVAATPFARSLAPEARVLIDAMVNAFNTQLASQLKDVSGVRLVDAYSVSKDQAANPTAYGLSNVTDVACANNALAGSSLACNGNLLVLGDTSRYQFADDVHPTPYAHQLLAQLALKELAQAGWL